MSPLIDKITAAHARDRVRVGDRPACIGELPRSFNSLTPQWLTELLCPGTASESVTGYHLENIEQCSSNGRKVFLQYSEDNPERPRPAVLFCKAAHDLDCRIVQAITGGSRNETLFYNTIRPLLPIEAPRPVLARLDSGSFNSLLILPDVGERGGRFLDHHSTLSRADIAAQLRVLADLHGKCYQDPEIRSRLRALPSWPELFHDLERLNIEEISNGGLLAGKDVISPRTYRQLKRVWPAAIASVERHAVLPDTLIHGDVHLRNWYIAGTGEMGLSDWETASRGHWSRDVAYILSTALTIEHRRLWERDLLRLYLDRLRVAGGPSVAFDEAWTHYRQQQMSALVWWSLALAAVPGPSVAAPGNMTLEYFRRTVVAVDDLESLSSF